MSPVRLRFSKDHAYLRGLYRSVIMERGANDQSAEIRLTDNTEFSPQPSGVLRHQSSMASTQRDSHRDHRDRFNQTTHITSGSFGLAKYVNKKIEKAELRVKYQQESEDDSDIELIHPPQTVSGVHGKYKNRPHRL